MTTETNIVIRENDNALLLPSGAIQAGRIWRVRDGRVEALPVKTGANGADNVEILEGVSEADVIVAAPDATLRAGDRVRALPLATAKP